MSDTGRSKKAATQIVTGGRRKALTGAVVNVPVWRGSTHLYDDVAALEAGKIASNEDRFFYGRRGSPTQWSLAEALTEMEPGAAGTMLYPSGVAAISCALLSVLKPGDTLLMTDNAYDPSRSFADDFLGKFGIKTRYFDPSTKDISAYFCDNTRAILMENPGSLTFEIMDVPAICAAAKARGIVTLLDNTWATPYYFTALEKGVDLTILAGTKYICGHSDVMMGSVTTHEGYWNSLKQTTYHLGQILSPDDAYLVSRGLRTLSVRMDAHQASALKIAQWLQGRDEVARVLHPALPDHPSHALWARDFTGSSGLFSIVLNGSKAKAAALVDALELFAIGYSWGGFESLAIPIHPERFRTETDWPKDAAVVRLQIGLEDSDDLIADIDAAFSRTHNIV